MKVKIKKLSEAAKLPVYGTEFSVGADLFALSDDTVTVMPGKTYLFKTGLAIEIPEGYVGLIYARSGLATKRGLAPANKVGVIDSDYRGECMVALHNHSDVPAIVEPGERIAQLVIAPYLKAEFELSDELSETVRSDGGFGSTGRK